MQSRKYHVLTDCILLLLLLLLWISLWVQVSIIMGQHSGFTWWLILTSSSKTFDTSTRRSEVIGDCVFIVNTQFFHPTYVTLCYLC